MSDQPQRIGQEGVGKGDPTALTLDLLQREIAQLLQLLDARMTTINQSILDQKELRNAQLAGVQQQLTHAENLRKELKDDNEKNIDRALTGVERATEKLETSMTRTLGQVMDSNKADIEGVRRDIDSLKDRITDNKERIGAVDAQRSGMVEGRAGMTDTMRLTITVVLGLIAVIGFVLAQRGTP